MVLPEVMFGELESSWNEFSLFHNLNIEYRTRNFEQQKFLKEERQCFSLRYSAVHYSAVLRFVFSTK